MVEEPFEDIPKVEMSWKDILKSFTKFYDRYIIPCSSRKKLLVYQFCKWINSMVGHNSIQDVYKGNKVFN